MREKVLLLNRSPFAFQSVTLNKVLICSGVSLLLGSGYLTLNVIADWPDLSHLQDVRLLRSKRQLSNLYTVAKLPYQLG